MKVCPGALPVSCGNNRKLGGLTPASDDAAAPTGGEATEAQAAEPEPDDNTAGTTDHNTPVTTEQANSTE